MILSVFLVPIEQNSSVLSISHSATAKRKTHFLKYFKLLKDGLYL